MNGGIDMKKTIAKLMVVALCITISSALNTNAKTKISVTKSMNLTVKESKTIKVKGYYIKSRKYKSTNKKVATVNKKGEVTGKKTGTAKITVTVKYGNPQKTKKYKCKVVVEKAKKRASEKKALVKLIKSKKEGSRISTNLDSSQYTWDTKGHLIGIDWDDSKVKGKISFSSLPNLEKIVVGWNNITKLDVSKNKKLRILSCANTKLKKLDLENNANVEKLWYTAKNAVNLSKLSKLKELRIQAGEVKRIDLSKNKNLEIIDLNNTQIENLVIEGFPKLVSVGVSNNKKMKSIVIRNNSELTEFNIDSNPKVTSIDLSGLTKIKKIGHSNIGKVGYLSTGNNVTSIDVSGDVCLEELTCNNATKLTEIKMEGLTKLKHLNCRENGLKKLDLSDLQRLETLDCAYNKIDSLDVSKNTALESLDCSNNKIMNLDLSRNPKLEELKRDDTCVVTGYNKS